MIQGYTYPSDIREQTAQLGVSKWLTKRVDFVVRVSEHKVKIKSRKTVELFTWMAELFTWMVELFTWMLELFTWMVEIIYVDGWDYT